MNGNELISLSAFDLALAAILVLALAALSFQRSLDVSGKLLVAAVRTVVQLLLVGLVLEAVFRATRWYWLAGISFVMLIAAGREVRARQSRPMRGVWGFATGSTAMFLSSFSVCVLALLVVVRPDPWYQPQYAIPLLGMLLGNTMNGVALGIGRFSEGLYEQRRIVEQRLLLGQTKDEATLELRRTSVHNGMVPILNSMAAAGLVSLPGMMTGQILAGSPPVEAVKYQILIMFLVASGTGFGVLFSVWLTAKRSFDERHRLRLERFRTG